MNSMDNNLREDNLPCLGWREWVRLPELGLPWIRAKIDTGARTSALHACEIEKFDRDGIDWVRFRVHPRQHNEEFEVEVEAEMVDERHVRSSHGKRTYRPVIRTSLEVLGQTIPLELTLVGREKMKYRMLIGREALRNRFVVNPGLSYLGGRQKRGETLKLT